MQDYKEIFASVQYHPFFQGMDKKSAMELVKQCQVKNYEKMDIIFYANKQQEGLLLLLSGVVEGYVTAGHDHYEVLEVVQKGEMTGFSSLADFIGVSSSKPEQMVELRATEASKALLIPFQVITKRWDDPNVRDYLLAQIANRLKDIYTSLAEQVKLSRQFGESTPLVIRVQDVMTTNVITIHPKQTIKEVAKAMSLNRISSILVVEDEKLTGIITERDLVERVISVSLDYDSFVDEIMTKNPVTISRFAYYYDALSLLLLKGVKHLPVVDGGEVVGIVSLSDLMRKKNRNMIRTLQQIDEANEQNLPKMKDGIYEVLETFLQDQVPVLSTLQVITELFDRLVNRCITLALASISEKFGAPPVAFCIYQMGSSGRGEQFLLTDQDHFLVYDNSESDAVEQYFAQFTIEMVRYLQIAGYAHCKGNMMASADNWRGSISRWENRLREWSIQATNENLLLAQNFFSYRLIYGNENLHQDFEETIAQVLQRSKIFLYRLTQVEKEKQIPTLDQPIRSLFKLERKQIDMKKEILFPYHHSLQILSLVQGNLSGTPIERIDILKSKGVFAEDFAKDLKMAVSQILKLYVKQKFKQYKRSEPTSSILHFTHLTTREKEELILSLKTFRELQGYVFGLFSL